MDAEGLWKQPGHMASSFPDSSWCRPCYRAVSCCAPWLPGWSAFTAGIRRSTEHRAILGAGLQKSATTTAALSLPDMLPDACVLLVTFSWRSLSYCHNVTAVRTKGALSGSFRIWSLLWLGFVFRNSECLSSLNFCTLPKYQSVPVLS